MWHCDHEIDAMRYKIFATWILTALKLDLRKPGFCLLSSFSKGKGRGKGKGPKTQVGWSRLPIENLVQRQDLERCPGTPTVWRCLAQWNRPGLSWQSFAPQWRPQQTSAHPVCSWRESLPYLYHLRLEEVKLGAWNSNPGQKGPL